MFNSQSAFRPGFDSHFCWLGVRPGERAIPERSALRYDIIRPLCWLGLLHEEREGLTIWQRGTYHKTPLWPACLKLESDMQSEFILH